MALKFTVNKEAFVDMQVRNSNGDVVRNLTAWSPGGAGERDVERQGRQRQLRRLTARTQSPPRRATVAARRATPRTSTVNVFTTMKSPSVTPAHFYAADGDGFATKTDLKVTLQAPATFWWKIADKNGNVVRTFVNGASTGAGQQTAQWDGKDGNGSFVPDGTYYSVTTTETSAGTYYHSLPIEVRAFRLTTAARSPLKRGVKYKFFVYTAEPLSARPKVRVFWPGLAAKTYSTSSMTRWLLGCDHDARSRPSPGTSSSGSRAPIQAPSSSTPTSSSSSSRGSYNQVRHTRARPQVRRAGSTRAGLKGPARCVSSQADSRVPAEISAVACLDSLRCQTPPPKPVTPTSGWSSRRTTRRRTCPRSRRSILEQLPGATLFVVDDSSPDGTGELADQMAAENPRVRVLHRQGKEGLGKAYIDGFQHAIDGGAGRVVQMDADWSHDPKYLPGLVDALADHDLVIGSRYVEGGGVVNWGLMRRFISRGGSLFARTILRLSPKDLTGGFKAWRRDALAGLPWDQLHSGGYVFQIETTFRASRAGARVTEVPIVFVDRVVGASKMSRRIIVEALAVVLQLRWEELRSRRMRRKR